MTPPEGRMTLFQYWDSPEPPAQIGAWIEGFRSRNPQFEHVLFDQAGAEAFIARHRGPRELAAFRACAPPAMQADYLRLCVMDALGGVYVDADFQSLEPLQQLVDRAPEAMMLIWNHQVVTGFLVFRRPGNAFVRACLKLATENIEARRFTNVFNATGPGVVNAIRVLIDPSSLDEVLAGFDNRYGREWNFPELVELARASITVTPELTEAFGSITLLHTLSTARWLGTAQPDYKRTPRHWLTWQGPLYRAP